MKTISWEKIEKQVNALHLNPQDFDLVVAIARDGIEFGKFMSKKISLPLETIALRAYNDEMPPKKISEPKLTEEIEFDVKGKKILLVDKIVKSGTTMEKAIGLLREKGAAKIMPLAIAGEKEHCLVRTADCFECK